MLSISLINFTHQGFLSFNTPIYCHLRELPLKVYGFGSTTFRAGVRGGVGGTNLGQLVHTFFAIATSFYNLNGCFCFSQRRVKGIEKH